MRLAALAMVPLSLLPATAAVEGRRFAPSDAPPELQPAVHRAERAIRADACDAERRFGEGDPDANATACEDAKSVPGVRVGRTSARLRNPENAPPPWARSYVAETDGSGDLRGFWWAEADRR